MALSEQELRALREIEQSLRAEDPKFAASVSRGSTSEARGSLSLQGLALLVLGLCLMVGGVALAQRSLWFVVLSIFGFAVMFGAAIWMLLTKVPNASRMGSGKRTLSHSRKTEAGGVGARLEENFRRRFDN